MMRTTMVVVLLLLATSRKPSRGIVLARGFRFPSSFSSSSSSSSSPSSSFVITGRGGGHRWPSGSHRRLAPSSATSLNTSDDMISISDAYDGGNGEFSSARMIDDNNDQDECDCDLVVCIKIRPDPFRSTLNEKLFIDYKRKSVRVRYVIENAGDASYADAYAGYSTFVTRKSTPFDPHGWERTSDTSYDDGKLSWTHVHEFPPDNDDGGGVSIGRSRGRTAYFAYFPPYSYERHLGLISRCEDVRGCTVTSLGRSLNGREIDCVSFGNGPRTCWIIHRQHPGETMASFFAEGLLTRLLGIDIDDDNDGGGGIGSGIDVVARDAREMYTFHVVPNVNPDGSALGYLRTNAVGSNLNREWCPSPAPPVVKDDRAREGGIDMYEAPTLERSPEAYHVLREMDRTGVDAFLDVHGDEGLPFVFLAGSQGTSVWGKRLECLHGTFLSSYERCNRDVQCRVSYDPDAPGEGMRNICSNQIAERFNCFSGTLEMPFKECWSDGNGISRGEGDKAGWGPERARRLGASVLEALCYIWPYLRDDGEFWEGLPKEDAYINPSSRY
ncbi:hypothetical protein ACHAXA_011023 [Cyclostephanos tholiformis]|uniref:Peptidase M14 domain-containing protein n=1 Tax=Cyclostephanos tholiformis TaxID=382380 RepID=A0ABD3RYS5_9STRA